jgi:hypothetical protein
VLHAPGIVWILCARGRIVKGERSGEKHTARDKTIADPCRKWYVFARIDKMEHGRGCDEGIGMCVNREIEDIKLMQPDRNLRECCSQLLRLYRIGLQCVNGKTMRGQPTADLAIAGADIEGWARYKMVAPGLQVVNHGVPVMMWNGRAAVFGLGDRSYTA